MWVGDRPSCHHRVMGELLIVSGPPGAGKSTVAALLVGARSPSVLIEGDAFFGFLRNGRVDPWLRDANAQNGAVTDAAAATTGRFVANGYWTVYDGLLGTWFLPQFMASARVESAHYVVLLPSVEECVARVSRRRGHGFTDHDATRQMHAEFVRAGIEPRHIVDGEEAAADKMAATVTARLEAGELLTSGRR